MGNRTGTASKPWSLPVSVVFTAAVFPLLFWLQFGFLDGYAYGVTAFLILLQVAVEVLPRKADEAASEKPTKIPKGRFDFLGAVWLLSIPFAPFFGWIVGNVIDVDASNWRAVLTARSLLCIVVPVVCVLPLIRYIRRPHLGFMVAVLAVGTGFPVLTGLASAADLVRGPEWQDVEITGFRDVAFRTRAGTNVRVKDAFVELADGRELTRTQHVTLHLGPARVLVLRALSRIIDAAPL